MISAGYINPEPLEVFAETLAPCNFSPTAFVACYGMAECVLATSFAPLGAGLSTDAVDQDAMMATGEARPVDEDAPRAVRYTDCGVLLPDYEMRIVDEHGSDVPERQCGRILLRGPSVMSGYFRDVDATRAVLGEDGWLDTGDIGYRVADRLFITARSKDVIIIKGRNIWPHDMEMVAHRVDGVRLGGVAAFSLSDHGREEQAVMVVETKERNEQERERLRQEITELMHEHFGINVVIDLVRTGTLPRTSSGKLSRFKSREAFLQRRRQEGPKMAPKPATERKIA